MPCYSLSHLSDGALLSGLSSLAARDRVTTAELLAHLAEVDMRKLYRPAAYSSMVDYCVGDLKMSEDAAFKLIRASRAARDFPGIFEMVADGRLHLTAVFKLAPHLTEDNAEHILSAAANKTKTEIDRLIAQIAPRPDMPTHVEAIAQQVTLVEPREQLNSSGNISRLVPEPVEVPAVPSRVSVLAPQRFALQVTIGQDTHDKLRYFQALLSHSVPSGDLAGALDRALDLA